MLSAKDFFKHTPVKKKGRFNEQSEEKRNELGKKTRILPAGLS